MQLAIYHYFRFKAILSVSDRVLYYQWTTNNPFQTSQPRRGKNNKLNNISFKNYDSNKKPLTTKKENNKKIK